MAHLNLQAWPQAAMPTTPQVRVQFFAQHAMAEQAARDLVSVNDRQASIESRVQSMQAATEQAAKDLCLAYDRQVSIESRMESVEARADSLTAMAQSSLAWCRGQFAAMAQQAGRDLVSANDWRANLENGMLQQSLQQSRLTQSVRVQATRDFAAANDRQDGLENRMESIEKLLKEHIASTSRHVSGQSSLHAIQQNNLESFKKLATELMAATELIAAFENRMESIEKLVNEHIASTS